MDCGYKIKSAGRNFVNEIHNSPPNAALIRISSLDLNIKFQYYLPTAFLNVSFKLFAIIEFEDIRFFSVPIMITSVPDQSFLCLFCFGCLICLFSIYSYCFLRLPFIAFIYTCWFVHIIQRQIRQCYRQLVTLTID